MLQNASHFNTGDVSQVNAQNYQHHEPGSIAVRVSDGGHYSSSIVYNHQGFHAADPLKELYGRTAVGAMHNSDDRADAPKCHPETRQAVQANIFSWMATGDRDDQPKQILWLTGPAGSGKTAIMGTVSDKLQQMGHLAASFYFASYTTSVDRKSKRQFVTTLAYQLQGHRGLKARISTSMMATIQQDPAVFKMKLSEQMEKLVLVPLRESVHDAGSDTSMIIVVDGIDECGEDRYDDPSRSKERDQLEVLSVILQATRDSAFPCRFVVASRPENWIRRFFEDSAAGHITEIFLDDSFDPGKDIKLFLDSKFAELGRRYGYRPSTWPKEEDVAKLVENASGQFIYAATVIRFIDTPPFLPLEQLNIVLSIKPPSGSSPFRLLDALYTSILLSSPTPRETVLWLKSIQRLRSKPNSGLDMLQPSAWTIDRLFESVPGQAKMVLGLPSLVYFYPEQQSYDAWFYIEDDFAESQTSYGFYHKSFLDYLEDPARYGVTFPDIDDCRVQRWVWGRIAKVLECDGPEIPIESGLLTAFTTCVQAIWALEIQRSQGRMRIQDNVLSRCDPMLWLQAWSQRQGGGNYKPLPMDKTFWSSIFILVHKNCQLLLPCHAGCRRWRSAIKAFPKAEWKSNEWTSSDLLLDKLCLRRLLRVDNDKNR